MDVQHCGSSVLLSVTGELDQDAGAALQHALDDVSGDERDLMVDLHGVMSMDSDGLLHFLDLHRRAEHLGLRVLVIDWQPQPQQLMAEVAGIPGPGSATGERYALAGFRRLCQRSLRCPGGWSLGVRAGGHQNSMPVASGVPGGGGQCRGITPLPARASASRWESPVVVTRWAWCIRRSVLAPARVLGMIVSKPEG